MRKFVVRLADSEIVNLIEIDPDCVPITQAEADAMPEDELAAGSFYILPDGHALQDFA